MTISFTNAVGNLFPRLGKIGALIKNMNSYQQTQLQATTNTTTGVVSQFNTESDIQALMGSSYIGVLNSAGSIGNITQSIAQATINRMVFRDSPRLNQTLQSITLNESIQYVIQQMQLANATVLAMTVSATPATFNGVGNGVITASVKRPLDGRFLENAFAEIIQTTCTADSYTGNVQVGNEGMTISSTGSENDPFAFDWPLGSNAAIGINAINGNSNNGQGNLLTNSNFSVWATGLPENFNAVIGGTNLHQETSITYDNNSCLRISGDSVGSLTQINQQFGNNDTTGSNAGTSGDLTSLTQYSFNVFLRRDGTSGSGTLTVDLVDVNGNVIQDENQVSNTFSINLVSLTTNYSSFTGIFRTPEALPNPAFLRIRLTSSYPNGQSFYLAKASMGVMNQVYTSGPFIACHSGSVPFVAGDFANTTITNSRGAGGTLSTFQTLLAILFFPTVYQQEFLFPSSSSPTISDNLIG